MYGQQVASVPQKPAGFPFAAGLQGSVLWVRRGYCANAGNAIELQAEGRIAGAEQAARDAGLGALTAALGAQDADTFLVAARRRATRREIERQIVDLCVIVPGHGAAGMAPPER